MLDSTHPINSKGTDQMTKRLLILCASFVLLIAATSASAISQRTTAAHCNQKACTFVPTPDNPWVLDLWLCLPQVNGPEGTWTHCIDTHDRRDCAWEECEPS